MMKNLFALLFMVLSLSAVFAEEKSKTVVYKEGDVQYSKIEKEVFWYNKDSKLIKVETYFNANGLEETGLDLQVAHFNNGNPVKNVINEMILAYCNYAGNMNGTPVFAFTGFYDDGKSIPAI